MNESEPQGHETGILSASPGEIAQSATNALSPVSNGSRQEAATNPASDSLSTSHPSDVDAPHRWEESSGEERDRWWHTDYGVSADW